jgi:hypothetical protein
MGDVVDPASRVLPEPIHRPALGWLQLLDVLALTALALTMYDETDQFA